MTTLTQTDPSQRSVSPGHSRPEPANPVALTIDDVLHAVARNPLLRTLDLRDVAPAKSFRHHHRAVSEAVADWSIGSLVVVVQPSKSGFWISEWTVLPGAEEGSARVPSRRRIARGKSLDATFVQFEQLLSFHSSHFFFAEEGLRGWWNRR